MAKYFGKTWWGEKWLGALEDIDYSNRLPRGSAYARKGAVRRLQLESYGVDAKVKGSYNNYYRVVVALKPISPDKVDALISEIQRRPVILSKLLNRELDPEVLKICEQVGIKIFPSSWKDLNMACTCPDWAVPCKHIAAVIYLISKEIDNNPFVIFKIHGIDLLEELRTRGTHIEVAEEMKPQALLDLMTEGEDAEMATASDAPLMASVSDIPDIGQALVSLLPKNPPFYNRGDFAEKYDKALTRISKTARYIIEGKKNWEDWVKGHKEITRQDEVEVTINKQLDADMNLSESPEPFGRITDFLPAFAAINPNRLDDYTPSVAAMWQAIFLATHLLARGAVTPRIVEAQKGYTVIWHPAMIEKSVVHNVNQLQQMLPKGMVLFKKPKVRRPVEMPRAAYWLLSTTITQMVDLLYHSDNDEMSDLFFKISDAKFNAIGDSEISGNIRTWLDCYYMNIDDTKLEMLIDDLDDCFALSLFIDNGTERLSMKDVLNGNQPQLIAKAMKKVAMLYNVVPWLDYYINNLARTRLKIKQEDFVDFLFNSMPVIKLLGIKTVLPKSIAQLIRPKVSGRISTKGSSTSFFGMEDLLQFDWQVALGDTVMSPAEFDKLIGQASGLLKFKGQYVYATAEDLAKLQKVLQQPPRLTAGKILQTVLAGEYDGATVLLTDEVKTLMRRLTSQEEVPLPQELKATLRPYQKRGYSWMYRNMKLGFGSLIADDMGLGKTLQVIALLLKVKEEGNLNKEKVAIVVPTGLITNWESELKRFAPTLSFHTYHGPTRDLSQFNEDILLTSYGVARSDHDLLKKKKWQVVVIDEAQNIKNHTTGQSKAVKALNAKTHIAMSGTPVENRLSEYWSIMDFADHGLLGTVNKFEEEFAKKIQRFGDTECAERLKRITAPFILRRLKSDKSIISDLPDKIERDEFALLQPQQAALYHKTVEEAMGILEGMDDSKSAFQRAGIVLQMMLALKQICDHPALFLKNDQRQVELSGKAIMLIDTLRSIIESKEKVLIFTQFAEMGELLCQMIDEQLGEPTLFYHGGLTLKNRKAMVELFQNDKGKRIFILSLKAGGTGLNLTAATHVIHYDLWWNPAVEAQATDRAYRIGQHSNVQVHRFITQHTFEEKINQMIQDKKNLAEMTVSTGENWIGKLSNKQLREIFG